MKRKLTAVFLAAFLILGNTAGVLAADSSDQTVPQAAGELVIYHTNDTHGYLSDGSVSIDQVAGLKDATPGSILVDAGDATQGLPLGIPHERLRRDPADEPGRIRPDGCRKSRI